MFSQCKSSGKHLIADIQNIKNTNLMNDTTFIEQLLDTICDQYNYTILNKMKYQFTPLGFTILYLLAESHISIHTFPEQNYLAFDLYTCKQNDKNDSYIEIYNFILRNFDADGNYTIIDRRFME